MNIEKQIAPTAVGVLIVYDNVRAGKRAKQLCDRIQRFLGPKYELHLHPWNMAVLQNTSFDQAAMEVAEWPSILIIAASGNESLPEFFKSWICRATQTYYPVIGAIVLQVHGIPRIKQEFAPPYKDLRQIARDTGIAFLSEVVDLSNRDPELQSNLSGQPVMAALP